MKSNIVSSLRGDAGGVLLTIQLYVSGEGCDLPSVKELLLDPALAAVVDIAATVQPVLDDQTATQETVMATAMEAALAAVPEGHRADVAERLGAR